MEISLVLDTITGYKDGDVISFYSESARVCNSICGRAHSYDETYLGASWQCPSHLLDIITPKLVKAGYKIQIKNGTRLNHD